MIVMMRAGRTGPCIAARAHTPDSTVQHSTQHSTAQHIILLTADIETFHTSDRSDGPAVVRGCAESVWYRSNQGNMC